MHEVKIDARAERRSGPLPSCTRVEAVVMLWADRKANLSNQKPTA